MAVVDSAFLPPVCIGIDIGQLHDPTAISVAECSQVHTGKYRQIERVLPHVDNRGQWVGPKDAEPVMRTQYTIRHIERLPLHTSYPDVAVRIADMLCNPIFIHRKVRVFLDVTGVGRPVYQDLQREISLRPEAQHVQLKPITFTSGQNYNRSTGSLGKAYLVSRLQSLLQGNYVHAPDTAEVRAMLEELKVYEIRVDRDGHDSYGAFKVGTHDDLATALGLAVLTDPYADTVRYLSRVY